MKLTAAERAVFLKYADLALPRHTSYPIAPFWKSDWQSADAEAAFRRSAATGRGLSLYVHVPFCRQLCFYCGCTKEIIGDGMRAKEDPAAWYMDGLEMELGTVAAIYGSPVLKQLHFGGGTPTFLRSAQLDRVFRDIRKHFKVAADAEIAVELDPRVTTREHLDVMVSHGVNRVSFGVQDFDPGVQQVVNRIQPYELVKGLTETVRSLKIPGLNFDLIYGLPGQTPASLTRTLDQVIGLRPDRIAFYRLAVMPEIFKWQRSFSRQDLPAGAASLDLMELALEKFAAAGYEYIGLDHFALPDDELTRALRDGTMQRTFQGMTTGGGLDVIGVGPSAISLLADAFSQNIKSSRDWIETLRSRPGTFPAVRGMVLSQDDRIRQEILQDLYGWGEISFAKFAGRTGQAFEAAYQGELERLRDLEADGLLRLEPGRVVLTPVLGRLLVRVVAAVFDAYIPKDAYKTGLSDGKASRTG